MNNVETLVRKSIFIENFITDAVNHRLSHAYMIIGEDNESLNASVKVIEQAIFCGDLACGKCNICTRIANGNNANIHEYETYNREIINEIISLSYMQPLEEGLNVFVLKQFDTMQARMQNAMLKTIEEPQKGVLMILTATNESAVLSTIKSRVKKINLNIWNKSTIAAELKEKGYSADSADFASSMCAGSLVRAIALADDGGAKKAYDEMYEIIVGIQNSSMIPNYIKKFGTDRTKFASKLEMLELIYFNALQDSVNGYDTDVNKIYSVAAISNIIESIADAESKNKVNISIDNIVTDLLLNILEKRFRTA